MEFHEYVGKKFGKLTILTSVCFKGRNRMVSCSCDCGNVKNIMLHSIQSGVSKSCGCLQREGVISRSLKHGDCKKGNATRFYNIWHGMRQRCRDENGTSYKYYGGREICVADQWHDFLEFKKDMYEGYVRHCEEYGEKQTTIDRINNDGNYEPGNCRWATYKEQVHNQRKRQSSKGITVGVG